GQRPRSHKRSRALRRQVTTWPCERVRWRRTRSDRGERSARFFVAAVFVPALDGRAGLLAELFDEERWLAAWAGFIGRPVPAREHRFRVIRSGVIRTAFPCPL